MITAQDNELLTRVGPNSAMGNMIRRYWIPAMLSEELPERDGKPVRLRLMGEDLVAFRDTSGRVGLLGEHCPHRQASLALGVNEDNGLRCLYHGWKYAVDGSCQETPTEPEGSKLCTRVRATAYATHEAGGAVWAYMGPPQLQPAFPDFEFLRMPKGHCEPFKVLEDCNYAQAVEGTIDSAHAGVLHKEGPWKAPGKYEHERDLRPKLEVEFTNYGLRYCAVRKLGEDRLHARITQVVMPFFTLIPPDGGGVRKHRRMANAFVPRDDVSTWHIQWFFDTTQIVDRQFRIEEGGHWLDANYRKQRNIDNWYGQDRQLMKTESLSGIKGILTQDHAVSETQGRILDRTKEHLGSSDVAVVAWRRQMLRAARGFADAADAGVEVNANAAVAKVEAVTISFPADRKWNEIVPLDDAAAPKPKIASG